MFDVNPRTLLKTLMSTFSTKSNNLTEVAGEGDSVIAEIPEDVKAEFDQLLLDDHDLRIQMSKIAKKMETLDAKRTLLWDKLTNLTERSETAESRGLALGVRLKEKESPVYVLVEFKPE